jgi:Kef-type K+ transport system membrane component KefB
MRNSWYYLILGCLFPVLSWSKSTVIHFDPVSLIIFWVTTIYCLSVIGQFFAKKIGQPSVLGELVMGIIVGNLCFYFKVPEMILLREGGGVFQILPDLLTNHTLLESLSSNIQNHTDVQFIKNALMGEHGADLLNTAYVLDIFSRYGIIYLLFMVGLDTSWKELKKTGKPAIMVASIGVIAPMLLGFIVLFLFFSEQSYQTNLFIAATLSATSVGITARVLQELNKLRSQEAKIILGAAMIDDVLGLFILAVVSSLVLQGQISIVGLLQIVTSSILFFVCALTFGPSLVKYAIARSQFLKLWEAKVIISFVVIMLFSWMASLLQLSTIIGAFTAGVILDDELFQETYPRESRMKLHDLMAPLQLLLAPLFFFIMGIQVKLESFLNLHVILIALVLCIVAIVGKLLGGFGANANTNRQFIGVGMIPRGEVGLIFASMGRSIGVVNDQMFSAIVVMVVVTTVIAPPWMKWCMRHQDGVKDMVGEL